MKVKAILDNEIIDWIEVKKWAITEVDDLLWDYLLRAYTDRWEKVEEDDQQYENVFDDEKKEEKTTRREK